MAILTKAVRSRDLVTSREKEKREKKRLIVPLANVTLRYYDLYRK